MKTIIEIHFSTLRATLPTMGKKDIRGYLNGAYMDFAKGRIVSTNGHVMFCGQIATSDAANVIIPREAIEQTVKLLGGKKADRFMLQMTIEHGPDGPPRISLETYADTIHTVAIDGKFPEYERFIPRNPSGEVGQYNPDLLADCRDAINTYSLNKLIGYAVHHNGQSGALMRGPRCLCVVMPARLSHNDYDMDWLDGKTEEMQEAA